MFYTTQTTIMNKLKRLSHWLIFILAIIGYCMELFADKPHKTLVLVTIGVIGMLYCGYHIYILFVRLIQFDRILNKGHFLLLSLIHI